MTRWAGVLMVGVLIALSGCAESGLSASSSCQEFVEASPEEQQQAISELSAEFDTPSLTTPLGEPNVSFACADSPDMTLEEYFTRWAESES